MTINLNCSNGYKNLENKKRHSNGGKRTTMKFRFVFFPLIREGCGMLPFPPKGAAGLTGVKSSSHNGHTLDELPAHRRTLMASAQGYFDM